MKTGSLRLFLYGILLIAIQIVLLRHLQIFGATADLVLVYIVWLCIRRDKTLCLIYAAIFGLLADAYTDLWGLHMFSKTLLVFILHGYLNRIKEKRSEEHTSELQSRGHLVCRLLLEKKKNVTLLNM